jgi:uncharacterized protein (UPF0335 family)
MEIRSTEEARTNVETFAKRYIELLKQKKSLDKDIKALKEEFKEEGVPVGVVCKTLNLIKSLKKKSDSEIFEENAIKEWLEANADIDNDIGELLAK